MLYAFTTIQSEMRYFAENIIIIEIGFSEPFQDGFQNADVRRNEYRKRSPLSATGIPTEYHRNPNSVPQESQGYVLRCPNVERN